MAVKKQAIPLRVDFDDQRVKEFLKGGAPVLEDVLEEERKLERERIKEELKRKIEEEEKKKAEEEAKLKEEEDAKLQLISMRLPVKLLKEIDQAAKRNYTNRTSWIIEASLEKLKGNQ